MSADSITEPHRCALHRERRRKHSSDYLARWRERKEVEEENVHYSAAVLSVEIQFRPDNTHPVGSLQVENGE